MKSKEDSIRSEQKNHPCLPSLFFLHLHSNNKKDKTASQTPIFLIDTEKLFSQFFFFFLIIIIFIRFFQFLSLLHHYPWKVDFKKFEKIKFEKNEITSLLQWNDLFLDKILNKIHPKSFVASICFSSVPGIQVEQFYLEFPEACPRAKCTLKVKAEDPGGIEALGFYTAYASLAFEKSTGKKLKFEFSNVLLPKEKGNLINAVLLCLPLKEDFQ
ncbi:hypothetical protein [Methylacidiphilum caldifontis]|uniref:Uncharacterized protein n=1 Tax=Methylacidiphilum caldifontis TaxID=2795386 RepID=A0A4Y8P794_9BACT|nr:hypothetical protein [Methylacidiphilum caldifontis]TFE66176.1 hypothetical protein A7Q10_02245 [Methylacidiphilum caldifontis]